MKYKFKGNIQGKDDSNSNVIHSILLLLAYTKQGRKQDFGKGGSG